MQEGTEGVEGAIGKPPPRHRSGEIPAQYIRITLELPPAQSRKMGQGSYSLVSLSFPQQFLYFKPEPQGQGSLRPTRSDGFTRLGWRG